MKKTPTLLAATMMTLKDMPNDVLVAAHNSLTGFGKIYPENYAWQIMQEVNLIREDGYPYDSESLLAALSFEINRRLDDGTFLPGPELDLTQAIAGDESDGVFFAIPPREPLERGVTMDSKTCILYDSRTDRPMLGDDNEPLTFTFIGEPQNGDQIQINGKEYVIQRAWNTYGALAIKLRQR